MNQSIFMLAGHNYTLGNESVLNNSTRGNAGQFVLFFTSIGITLPTTLLGIIANLIVLVILHKKGNHRTIFDLTIVSLSVTDLLACTSVFSYVTRGLVCYSRSRRNDGLIIRRIAGIFFILSLFHVLLITFLRFFGIFWPMKYRQDMTKAKIKKLIATIWILSVVAMSSVQYTFKNRQLHCLFAIIILSLGVVVTTIYIMIAVKIFLLLKRKQFDWKNEHRVLLNSVGVTISYFACFSPYASLTITGRNNKQTIHNFLLSITMVNFLLDPFFYFYFSYWNTRRVENRRNRMNNGR